MNFTPPSVVALQSVVSPPIVEVGNVYKSKGGRDTVFWLIVGLKGCYAHALGIDKEGEIVSTTSYGLHTFESRPIIGKCEDIKSLSLDINWIIEP